MKEIIKLINNYMKNNKPSDIKKSEFSEHQCLKKWALKNGYMLVFWRDIKGDLISLIDGDTNTVVEWVDQTHQYNCLLGVNDFTTSITLFEVMDILDIKIPKISKKVGVNFTQKDLHLEGIVVKPSSSWKSFKNWVKGLK